MEIKYFGHSSFQIKSKNATLVTDPFSSDIGIKFLKTSADIVSVSHDHDDHANIKAVDGAKLLNWPGEFEIKGITVVGYPSFHDDKQGEVRGRNVMYKFYVDGISILHCGDLGHTLDQKTIDAIGAVDILLVPTGGHYTIGSADAVRVTKALDPYIVIPMHYKTVLHNEETFGPLEPLENFVSALGLQPTKTQKFVAKKEDFATETTTKLVVLES